MVEPTYSGRPDAAKTIVRHPVHDQSVVAMYRNSPREHEALDIAPQAFDVGSAADARS